MPDIPKVLIVATHPIQYHIPWFQALARQPEIDLEVAYVNIPSAQEQGVGFNVPFQWDIPMLEGYRWKLIEGVHHQPNHREFWARSIAHPTKTLQNLNPDLVILTGWQTWTLLQILWSCNQLKIPCIVRGESSGIKPRSDWVKSIHRLLLRQFKSFLVIGNSNHRFYQQNGITEDQIFFCRYFVDNQRFAETADSLSPQRDRLRQEWSIPKDSVCYCYVGKLEPKKRILDLLEAVRQFTQLSTSKPLHLLVVGTGELMDVAQDFVKEHQLPVTFAGFLNQSEIVQAYVAADCLVLPSDYGETWGLVVNEAMACGLPAVVSDRVGCSLDLIDSGITGEVFSFGNTQALAQILHQLTENPEKLKVMGKQAHLRVVQDYSIESAVTGTLSAVAYTIK